MEKPLLILSILRSSGWLRDFTVAVLAGTTMLMPCYAGIPDWWVSRGVVTTPAAAAVENEALINAGQFKNAVTQAVAELEAKHAANGGAGVALLNLVSAWAAEGPQIDNREAVNVGQVKAVLKLWYDRLNAIHGTTGYPWRASSDLENFRAVNAGQLKKLLQMDVMLPWDQNLAQGFGTTAEPELTPPTGAVVNQHAVLASKHHYLRNPLLSLNARGGNPVAIPANAVNIPSIPVATSAGEFKVGQDGSANYTIRLQGPKGVANVEPAISLDYNSNGGDGIVGTGWNLSGLSVINRGPTSIAVDGYYDPADFDGNDRFYLDGERLICVAGPYGQDGSEYRTLKEQFSRIFYHKTATEDWFEVKTKAGLTLEFGHCGTSCIGPQENGTACQHPKTTWAVCKVKDSLGNFWSVQYADLSPGQDAGESTPYLPDYQPEVIRYTGQENGLEPMHEIRFLYEPRPDQHRGYLMGFLVRKTQRLRGVEVRTDGVALRSWRLNYNIGSFHTGRLGERSRLTAIQEVAGGLDDRSASALPATEFQWDEGQRTWDAGANPAKPVDDEQTIRWPQTFPETFPERSRLRLEYRGNPWENSHNLSMWFPKGAQYVDLDGDGLNEILFNQRGLRWEHSKRGPPLYFVQHNYRYYLKKSETANVWEVNFLAPTSEAYPIPRKVDHGGDMQITPSFPYLSSSSNAPTGAFLADINGDGLPDIVSAGTFNEIKLEWVDDDEKLETKSDGKITNPSGVWINVAGQFVRDPQLAGADGILGTGDDLTAWSFPKVPTEFYNSSGTLIARPAYPPSGTILSGNHEKLEPPMFALHAQFDLGWRVIDMDGDGNTDIIRAGQGYEDSGWLNTQGTVSATGTGALSINGRQLCFGLRNKGPNAPPGERWELINPAATTNSIWKLPLPLVGTNGKLDLGRRLIDMNGDGLPDFVAQKKRNTAYPHATVTNENIEFYDLEVWLNRGAAGWEFGGSDWRLEGQILAMGLEGSDYDRGCMIQDLNGDGLPDLLMSFYAVSSTSGPFLYEAVFLNTGKGWVKKLDTPSQTYVPVNFPQMKAPEILFTRINGISGSRPYSFMDMTGDGRPEFLNGYRPYSISLPGTSRDLGLTCFMNHEGIWSASSSASESSDWNIPDELLGSTVVPLNFTELDGDGIMDVLRTQRVPSSEPEYTSIGSSTYFRQGLSKPPRITRITNGLGVPMDITYGYLPQLAGDTADHHYRHGAPPTDPQVSATIPPAAVVTHYSTKDGTELADGSGGSTITTSYYYSGLRSHARHGSLGFESMETRSTLSSVRQITYFSQNPYNDTVGMPVGGETYHLVDGNPVLLTRSSTTYQRWFVTRGREVAINSSFVFAHTVIRENWSPEGFYLGKTTSVSGYHPYGGMGVEHVLLSSQVVVLDQGTPQDFSDDISSSTLHSYNQFVAAEGRWRIGQISSTIVTSNAPNTLPIQKRSSFQYYPTGHAHEGMLWKESIDNQVEKEHIYDSHGNEVKTITRELGWATLPAIVSETWFSGDGRFPVATMNALGHTTCTHYNSTRSLATSSTMAFRRGIVTPSANASHSNTVPTAPAGTAFTTTVYDAWGTAKVTTAADGLRSVRYAMYFVDSALPRALYYVYEQAEGSPPVITYFDRYHRALLVEKTGFNGETILQEKQYDAKGRPVRVSKPYLAGAETPAYTVEEYDAYDRKVKVTAPDGSYVTIAYNGFEAITTNHRGQTHRRVADMSERVVKSTDTDGNFVTFLYTADGQPRESTTHYQGGGSASTTITTTYNAQRLKESVTDPNTGTSWTYYDAYGRIMATKDSRGTHTVFEYDLLGRTTKRWTGVSAWTADTAPTAFETFTHTIYDSAPGLGVGKPHTVTFTHKDGPNTRVVTESYVYDSLGRPVSSTTTLSGQVAFNGSYSSSTSYHPSAAPGYGRTATVTDPGGFTQASVYNKWGFLEKVTEVRGGPDNILPRPLGDQDDLLLWEGIAYDAEGKTLIEHHGNGLGTRARYHPTRGFVESSLTFRTANQQAVQNLELRVNDLGNVEWRRLTRHEAPSGAPVHEVKTESFSFDSQNRLTSSYVIGQDAQHFTFAANGNIASKTGTGSYTYGGAGAGPHAVTGVTLGGSSRRYTYDAKGRMENEYLTPEGGSELLLRQVAYTSFDQPQFIQHWRSAPLSSDLAELGESGVPWDQTCTMQFYFGAGLQRLISVKYKGLLKTQTLSLGGYEIRETTRGSLGTLVEKEERSSFGNGAKVKRWTAVNPVIPIMAYEYGVSDHLGSDSVTYTGEGQEQSQRGHLKEGEVQKTERQSYDAWGARRNADTWAPAKGPLGESNPSEEREGSNLARGYTGHEMLDDVGLIHMNGRLYDPSLGRMCGADPYVQTPENLQNYNRYSYVLNNPLSQIDPSGHFIIGLIVALGAAIIGAIGAVISTVLAFVAYLAALAAQFVVMVAGAVVQAFGAMGGVLMAAAKAGIAKVATAVTLKKIAIGAALSATYNGAQTAINGGSFSDVLKSAAIGAVTGAVGAVTGGFLHGFGEAIGGALAKAGMTKAAAAVAGKVIHAAAHGVAGGAMSAAMGGSFKDGFIGSAIGAGVSAVTGSIPGLDFLEGDGALKIVARTAVASISGGVASALAGGKFADGAFSAAFFHLFNHEGDRLISLFSNSDFSSRKLEITNLIKSNKKIMVVVGHGSADSLWDDTSLSTGGYKGTRLDASKVASMIVNHPDFKSVDEVWLLGCNNGNIADARGGIPIAQSVSDRIHKPVVAGSGYLQFSDGNQIGLVRGRYVKGAPAQLGGNPDFIFETPRVAPAPSLYRFQPRGFFQRKANYGVVEYNFKNSNGYGYYRY